MAQRHHQSIASVNSVGNNNNPNDFYFDPNQIYSQDISNDDDDNNHHFHHHQQRQYDYHHQNKNNTNEDSGLFFWRKKKKGTVLNSDDKNNYGSGATSENNNDNNGKDDNYHHQHQQQDENFQHLYHSPDRIGLGGSIISNPVTRTVVATISNTVGVGILCLAFAMHNASLGICVIELVVFCFLAIISDYILVVACEHTKQFSQQSLLSYCICGSPENMFDTPLVSRHFPGGGRNGGIMTKTNQIFSANTNNNDSNVVTTNFENFSNNDETDRSQEAEEDAFGENNHGNDDDDDEQHHQEQQGRNDDEFFRKRSKSEKVRRHQQQRKQEENAITKMLQGKSGNPNAASTSLMMSNKMQQQQPRSMGVFTTTTNPSVVVSETSSMTSKKNGSSNSSNKKQKSSSSKKASPVSSSSPQAEYNSNTNNSNNDDDDDEDEDDATDNVNQHSKRFFGARADPDDDEDQEVKNNKSSKNNNSKTHNSKQRNNKKNKNNNVNDENTNDDLYQVDEYNYNEDDLSILHHRGNPLEENEDDLGLFLGSTGNTNKNGTTKNKKKNNNKNKNNNNNINPYHHYPHQQSARSYLRKYKQALDDVTYYRKATLVVCDTIILIGALCLLIAYSRVIVTCCSAVIYKLGAPSSSSWVGGAATPWFVLWGSFFFVILSWKRILFEPPLVAAIKVGCIVFLVLCMVIQYGEVYYSSSSNNNKSPTSPPPSTNNKNNNNDDADKNIRYWGFYPGSLSALATLSLVCSYHVQTPVLYSLIQPRSPAAKMKAAWISNPITTLFFIMTGLIGYLSFGDLVSHDNNNYDINHDSDPNNNNLWLLNDGGDILNQYPRTSGLFTAARAIMIVHFAIAFPILAISVRESIHRLALVLLGQSSGIRDMNDVLKTSRLALIVESFSLILIVQLIAASVPGIGIVLNIGGAVSSSFSFLILPGIVGIYVFSEVDPDREDEFVFDDDQASVSSSPRSAINTTTTTAQNNNFSSSSSSAKNNSNHQHQMDEGEEENSIASPRSSIQSSVVKFNPTALSSSLTKGHHHNHHGNNNDGYQYIEARGSVSSYNHHHDDDDGTNSLNNGGGGAGTGGGNYYYSYGGGGNSSNNNNNYDTSSSVAGRQSRYADSVLRSAKRNDLTGWFGTRISAHSMRYISMGMLMFGVIVTIGGTVSAFWIV